MMIPSFDNFDTNKFIKINALFTSLFTYCPNYFNFDNNFGLDNEYLSNQSSWMKKVLMNIDL